MPIRVVTLPFDPNHGCFHEEPLTHFLLNKRVQSMTPAFFQHEGHPYWSVLIEYEPLLSEEEQRPQAPDLPEERQLLLARLREWRKERAERDGVPVFLVATNAQLLEVARRAPATLEALRQINGFGRKKVERWGKAIVDLIGAFLLQGKAGADAAATDDPERMPGAGKTAATPPGKSSDTP